MERIEEKIKIDERTSRVFVLHVQRICMILSHIMH